MDIAVRRISRGGELWTVVVMMLSGAALHSPVRAMAEDRIERPRAAYRDDYAAPTPQRPKTNRPSVDTNTTFAAKVKPGSFALVLNDGNRYIWTPAADQKLPLKTAFASVEVPLALVASVSFSDEQGAVKVTFRNGDVLTGKLLSKQWPIRTAYGDLTVPISAMTFLGAGGVTKLATATQQPNYGGEPNRYEPGTTLPPRPVSTRRIDRRNGPR